VIGELASPSRSRSGHPDAKYIDQPPSELSGKKYHPSPANRAQGGTDVPGKTVVPSGRTSSVFIVLRLYIRRRIGLTTL